MEDEQQPTLEEMYANEILMLGGDAIAMQNGCTVSRMEGRAPKDIARDMAYCTTTSVRTGMYIPPSLSSGTSVDGHFDSRLFEVLENLPEGASLVVDRPPVLKDFTNKAGSVDSMVVVQKGTMQISTSPDETKSARR